MARNPSYRAPRAKDVLHPPPFVRPGAPILPEQPLLDAVIAKPDENAPRFAIAAWYESAGKTERAEFIREQLNEHGGTGVQACANPSWGMAFEPWCARDLVYRRGFVEEMSLTGRSFLTLGEPLFRMTPLRSVRLVAIAPYFDELFDCLFLTRLRTLDLRGNSLDPEKVKRLNERLESTIILI